MSLFDKLKALFERVQKFLASPFQRAVGDRADQIIKTRECLADWIGYNIDNSVSYDGSPYAPLKYRTGKPLYLTGTMMRLARAAGGRATVTDSGIVAVLEEPPYAIYHELGTRTIPARPFFGIPLAGQQQLAEIWGGAIAQQLEMVVTTEASNLEFLSGGSGAF